MLLNQQSQPCQEFTAALILEIEKKDKHLAILKKQNKRLSDELLLQTRYVERLEKESREIVAGFCKTNRCDSNCPSFDLCKKRVLIVGGATRMEALYKDLIENNGGIFEYHDGYMKKGSKNLENLLKRADLVLCPLSCNSHAACSVVKNLGKKYNKPIHMMTNFSLNAVAQVIRHKESSSEELVSSKGITENRKLACSGNCANCKCSEKKKQKQVLKSLLTHQGISVTDKN